MWYDDVDLVVDVAFVVAWSALPFTYRSPPDTYSCYVTIFQLWWGGVCIMYCLEVVVVVLDIKTLRNTHIFILYIYMLKPHATSLLTYTAILIYFRMCAFYPSMSMIFHLSGVIVMDIARRPEFITLINITIYFSSIPYGLSVTHSLTYLSWVWYHNWSSCIYLFYVAGSLIPIICSFVLHLCLQSVVITCLCPLSSRAYATVLFILSYFSHN